MGNDRALLIDRLVRAEKVLQRVEKFLFDIFAGESGDRLVII